MKARYLELFINQYEDYSANISISKINGTTYNLFSYTIRSDIKKSYWSNTNIASFSTTPMANGVLHISLASANTGRLQSGRYVYDIFLIDAANTKSKFVSGIIYVDPSATVF